MNPTALPSAFQQNTTSYSAVPKADGGFNFFRIDVNPSNVSNPRQIRAITREEYTRAGYADPTASTYATQPAPTGDMGQTTADQGGTIAGDPYAAAYAAQVAEQQRMLAEQERQRSGLRSGIQSLIGQARDIYKNLYGGLTRAGESQKQQLEKTYGQGVQQLGETYSAEMPKIAQAYAARGAYDSTWRAGAEQQAQKGYESQLGQMQMAQQEALGKLGQALAESRAQYGAGESALQNVLGRLGEVTDLNELTALRNQIENKISDLQTAQAGQLTREEQLAQVANVPGLSNRFAQAQQTISTIIAGQAPAPLKRSIASQIIVNSDLTDQEKQSLQNQVNQIA